MRTTRWWCAPDVHQPPRDTHQLCTTRGIGRAGPLQVIGAHRLEGVDDVLALLPQDVLGEPDDGVGDAPDRAGDALTRPLLQRGQQDAPDLVQGEGVRARIGTGRQVRDGKDDVLSQPQQEVGRRRNGPRSIDDGGKGVLAVVLHPQEVLESELHLFGRQRSTDVRCFRAATKNGRHRDYGGGRFALLSWVRGCQHWVVRWPAGCSCRGVCRSAAGGPSAHRRRPSRVSPVHRKLPRLLHVRPGTPCLRRRCDGHGPLREGIGHRRAAWRWRPGMAGARADGRPRLLGDAAAAQPELVAGSSAHLPAGADRCSYAPRERHRKEQRRTDRRKARSRRGICHRSAASSRRELRPRHAPHGVGRGVGHCRRRLSW